MPSAEVDVATGLTFSLVGTSLSSRKIEDFTLPSGVLEMIQTSHQGTTGGHTYMAADIYEAGSFEFTLQHMQGYDFYADLGVEGAATITTPSGATITFTGILASYTPQNSTLNGKMLADVSVKVDGSVTVTDV